MNTEQLHKIESTAGFIAALDQSGGSTPKALMAYGLDGSTYADERGHDARGRAPVGHRRRRPGRARVGARK